MTADLLIIGGGAAGLAAAITAAEKSARVIIAEAGAQVGAKILRAGGGRCNVSNSALCRDWENSRPYDGSKFYGESANFVKPALFAVSVSELTVFFARCDLELFVSDEFAGGDDDCRKIFPRSEDGRDVVAALIARLQSLGVQVETNCRLTDCEFTDSLWRARDQNGREFSARKLLCATGSSAGITADCSASSETMIKKWGHSFAPFLPALAPLICDNFCDDFSELAGVSASQVEIRRSRQPQKKYRGDLLFTHSGLSGPAAIDISGEVAAEISAAGQCEISVNFLPDFSPEKLAMLCRGASNLRLPLAKRLNEKLTAFAGIKPSHRASELTALQRKNLFAAITSLPVKISRTENLARAMVARGGVKREEIAAKTLASKIQPELYFAGEIIDVDGISGGFNLHWAFAGGIFAATQMFRTFRTFCNDR